ncbi:hypothetical protein ABPG74_015025 [Tetrahymena malaccensis]
MKKQERRKSADSIQNAEGSTQNLNAIKGDVAFAQNIAEKSQSVLNDQDSLLNQQENQLLKKVGSGQNGGSQANIQQFGKSKSRQMIHSSSNFQANNSNSHNHLFLTSQGNNNNTNSSSNINLNGGQYKHIDQFPKISEAYSQLNNMVEFLEEKVDGVIERHEAEFLLAYKNHMIKIRKELQEMKNRMDEQDKKLKAGDKMDQLEKQLSWFREESLKLYEKLGQKDKNITDYKHTIQDQKKNIEFQEQQIAKLNKKIRFLMRKISSNENVNFDERSPSVSAQNYYSSQGANNQQDYSLSYINQGNNLNSLTAQSNNHFNRGKGSSNSIGTSNSRRPQSSEYSTNQGKFQQNLYSQLNGGSNANNLSNNINNINNLSNNNIYLSSLNQNTSNNQYNLLGDVAEQNETQNSQANNDDFGQSKTNIMRNTRVQFGQQANKFDGWVPQSDFIAEMVMKYENDQLALVREITHMFKVEDEKKQKQIKKLKERLDKVLKEKLTQNVVRSDLENFFLECIETVRKQIIKRKPPPKTAENQLNFYLTQIKDYSVFRNEDKIKILELLLSNERLLMFIYQKIFPQNFNKYMSQALDQTFQNTNEKDQSKTFEAQNLQQNQKLNGKNIDTDQLVQMVEEIQQQNKESEDQTMTTPVNKLSIQQQVEKFSRPQTREVEQYDVSRAIIQENKLANRQRPFTQQNQLNSNKHNQTFDEYNVNVSFQNQNKRSSNNSFSLEQNLKNNHQQQSNNIAPNSVKLKLNNLINNDFSSLGQQKRASFKAKISQYKIY